MNNYNTREKRYNSAFIHRVGIALVLGLIIGLFGGALVCLKVAKLYEIEICFDERKQLFLFLFLMCMLLCTLWIWLTNKWKEWAFRKVKIEDESLVKYKILLSKESLLFKKWKDITTTNKVLRIVGIILLMIGAYVGDHYRTQEDIKFEIEGEYTVGHIDNYTKKYKNKQMMMVAEYHYFVDSVEYKDESVKSTGWQIFPEEINGFSVGKGDEFMILYQKSDPTHNRLELQKPSEKVLDRYLHQVKERMYKTGLGKEYCDCLVEGVYKKFEMNGLAILYNKDVSYWDNENYNAIKFELLERKVEFKKIQNECSQIITLSE